MIETAQHCIQTLPQNKILSLRAQLVTTGDQNISRTDIMEFAETLLTMTDKKSEENISSLFLVCHIVNIIELKFWSSDYHPSLQCLSHL